MIHRLPQVAQELVVGNRSRASGPNGTTSAEAAIPSVAGSAPPELPQRRQLKPFVGQRPQRNYLSGGNKLPPAEAANHFRAGPPQEAPHHWPRLKAGPGSFLGADAGTCIVMAQTAVTENPSRPS